MLPKLPLLTFCFFLTANTFAQFNPKLKYGKLKDVEGNTYNTIKIGTQTWMAENLRVTKYNDGSNIPVVPDRVEWWNNWNAGNSFSLPMMCWYNNDQATYSANLYGALYNWFAINPSTNGNKNVCPEGWHVPTNSEWTILTTYLGGESVSFLGGESIGGGKMKSTGMHFWENPNVGANNSSGFSGLPGGYRSQDGSFNFGGINAHWWSSTEENITDSWSRDVSYLWSDVWKSYNSKYVGFSVRCVRD